MTDDLQETLGTLNDQLGEIEERIDALESGQSEAKETLDDVDAEDFETADKIEELEERIEHLENDDRQRLSHTHEDPDGCGWDGPHRDGKRFR